MNLLAGALLLLVVVGVAIAALYVLRRRAPAVASTPTSAAPALCSAFVGTAFAMLLGFVIFVAFESYDNARSQAQQEADAVQQLYTTTHFVSPPVRDELQLS